MAVAITGLGSGQIATGTPAAMYTAGSTKRAFIRSVRIYNTNAATQTVVIYINANVNPGNRQVARFVLAQNEFVNVLDEGEMWMLAPSDVILGVTTTASAVDYVITGAEQ